MKKHLVPLFILFILLPAGCGGGSGNVGSTGGGTLIQQAVSPFGMANVFNTFEMTTDRADELVALTKNSGAKWIREDFTWAVLEPEEGVYDEEWFAMYDANVERMIANGISILGVVIFEAPWSSGDVSPNTTEHYEDYASFVKYLVNRYKGKIDYWEIWNEPEVAEFWKPEPNSRNYYDLLRYAYAAAKEADPNINIVAPSSMDLDFVKEVFGYGGGQYMDILSLHPFCDPGVYETCWHSTGIETEIRTEMANRGLDFPIWATETGYPTHSGEGGVSVERQSVMLVRSYLTLLALDVEVIFWCNLNDGPNAGEREHGFGLLDSDYSVKTPYAVHANMVSVFEGAEYKQDISTDGSTRALLFEKSATEKILALWSFDEAVEENGTVTSVTGKDIQLTISGSITSAEDIYLNNVSTTTGGSTISMTVTNSPVYLTGNFSVTSISVTDSP